jgi:hypothetical protein
MVDFLLGCALPLSARRNPAARRCRNSNARIWIDAAIDQAANIERLIDAVSTQSSFLTYLRWERFRG